MNSDRNFTIVHAEVVTPRGIIHDGAVQVEKGIITYVGSAAGAPSDSANSSKIIDAKGSYVLPGFIDVHVHGGMLEDFSVPSQEGFDAITKLHCSQGTTSMLATSMTMPKEVIDEILEQVNTYIHNDMPYAQLVGVHLEGPFISPKWPGSQNPVHIVPPNREWVEAWETQYPGLIKQVTFAPEREGAHELIRYLRKKGIVAAAGHTDATYEEIMAAAEVGLHHAVHMFNAMTPLHHRKPGTAGALLSNPALSAEIIADGIHVHKAGIQLLASVKTDHNLILITDAMSAAGLGNGEYMLGDLPVVVKDNVCTLKENEATLAGSTLTMIRGFRHLVQEIGLSVERASEAASLNPAKLIRIDQHTGSIETGKQADLLLVDPDLNLQDVWVKGRLFQN
ncbi:N-acetylglucosamine-6-phosphate deacetylase [Paenibacillus anaericanus]|uniref:N-acetylglucosamine-6-phosphate deacetylase n=1 Tax=Paenibacillus anaericanus TaxID=170367 RepID=A0A3S1BSP7_9BACL|nr:N-acetylglucosamine-6-phosphate deacetylase [Paenibacillus anaericanus]MDQ0090800.1 N-acetylglucosamine-6-phosphate deacetylase [Paenibacillus anaericanus]RUT48627.1 N-acetylglucosamine-6-phosphate deacetylase [Paenibacillus anaericanus]